MKKIVILLFIVIVFTFPAKALKVKGKAVFSRQGARKPLKKGMRLYPGDILYTGPKAQVILLYKDAAKITVHNNSRYLITTEPQKADKEGSKSMLVSGKASFDLSGISKLYKNKNEPYKLYTPTAIVGVRGTEFQAFSDKNGKSQVLVTEGKVAAATDTVGDDESLSGAKEFGQGEGFAADKSKSLTEGAAKLPGKKDLKKELGGTVKPDEDYKQHYYDILTALGSKIKTLHVKYKDLKDKMDLAKAEYLALQEKGEKEQAIAQLKISQDHGMHSFVYYRKISHRILQFDGYLVIFENSSIDDPGILALTKEIRQLAVSLKLKK